MDEILLPVIYEHYSASHVQHYPSSYDPSRYNATARGVESRARQIDPVAREQQLMSYLPPERLSLVWQSILTSVQRPGLQQFRDVTILFQAKNLKVLTKDTTWDRMMTRFRGHWLSAVDEAHVTSHFFFDVAMEICLTKASCIISSTAPSGEDDGSGSNPSDTFENSDWVTLLWKRCCLESWNDWIQQGLAKDPTAKVVFYPLSLLQASGSLTVETSPGSWLRTAGLLCHQNHASVKEHFAAGNVYTFANAAMETLALDKSFRRTWELVGGGLSHNPLALMKAYLHNKLRCHFALAGSIHKSTVIRSESRVSRELFRAMDEQFRVRNKHHERLTVPSSRRAPFYRMSTQTLLRWLRWNINKFCVGFEMVHSFQDPHFVTWEHTRMMLAFLRCLQFSCPSGLIQKAGGCWQDVRFQGDSRQPEGVRRVEGLGFQRTMEDFGYAWFLDKVDWSSLTFRPPHAPYMMFNNPSMQAAYHARYAQVRDVRLDFIRMDKARQWMIEFSAVPPCLDFLEKYLRQLCLCVFRKDVFLHIRSILNHDKADAVLAGEIPLCYTSINSALKKEHRPLKLARGNRLGVKSMDVLFSWLWEWSDRQFERKGWEHKPYRMLFRQSYSAVEISRGLASARAFRQELKKSFVRSHFIVPYPQNTGFTRKDKDTKDFVWWPSFYTGLMRTTNNSQLILPSRIHFRHRILSIILPTPEQRLLHLTEAEIYQELVRFREQWVTQDQFRQSHTTAMPPLEFNLQSKDYVGPTAQWCSKRCQWVVTPFEKCRNAFECSKFLRQELEKYEILRHQRQNRRRSRRKPRPSIQSDSEELGSSDASGNATSDEEGLRVRRRKQGRVVKQMEVKMREFMAQELQDWEQRRANYRPEDTAQWRRAGEYLEKEFNHRLRQVKS